MAEFLIWLDTYYSTFEGISFVVSFACLLTLAWLWGYLQGEKNGRR